MINLPQYQEERSMIINQNAWTDKCSEKGRFYILEKFYLDIRSPKGEVVSQKLHYKCAVFVGFFSQRVQFSNCFLKSLSK